MTILELLPNEYASDVQEIELIEDPPFLFPGTIYEAKMKYPLSVPQLNRFGIVIVGTEFTKTDDEDEFQIRFMCQLVLDVV